MRCEPPAIHFFEQSSISETATSGRVCGELWCARSERLSEVRGARDEAIGLRVA